jgi:uncharacterized protein
MAFGLALLFLAGALLAVQSGLNPSPAQAQTDPGKLPRTITVVGEGKVKIKPDLAQANIGVEVRKPTVKEASAEAKKVMEQVLKTLKAQGIEDKDMQTSGFNIWVESPPTPMDNSSSSQGQSVYHVSNQVMVNIHDLDKVGTILDAAIESGANSMYGITFSLADPSAIQSETRQKAVANAKTNPSAIQSETRQKAVANAKTKADELAGLTGVKVGEVVSVSEVVGGGYYPVSLPSMAAGMGGGGSSIQPGELEISTQLQLVYNIQ